MRPSRIRHMNEASEPPGVQVPGVSPKECKSGKEFQYGCWLMLSRHYQDDCPP